MADQTSAQNPDSAVQSPKQVEEIEPDPTEHSTDVSEKDLAGAAKKVGRLI